MTPDTAHPAGPASPVPHPWLTVFTRTYVPFALLAGLALLAAETTQNLVLHRIIYTIWATTALLIPALVFFIFADLSPTARLYWRWFWTFSYLVFLIHFYYSVFVYFGGIGGVLADRPRGMGRLVGGVNFFLTAWWTFDVLLSWTQWSRARWAVIQRRAAHGFIFLIFVFTLLRLRPNTVTKALGFTLLIAVALSLLLRLWLRERRPLAPDHV